MDDSIRVLHVDDDPEFADLAATFLERADERMRVETASRAAAGLERLADGDVDCVVSDYDMPGLDGIEFLEAVREEYPNLPFLLYTGKGSEGVASAAISAGVTDYLQKERSTDQYAVLANRVANAVEARASRREAERRRHRLEQVMKTVPACVVQIDYDGEFVFANRRAEEVLGLTRSDVTERCFNDPEWNITDTEGNPIPDEDLPFRRVRDSGDPLYGFRHTIEWPDGTRKVLEVNGAPLFDDEGTVESTVFALTDVTEREARERELEETNRQLEAVMDTVEAAIFIKDTEGRYQLMNQECRELMGLDPDADAAGLIDEDVFPVEAAERFRADDRRVIEAGETVRSVEEVPRAGETRTHLTLKSPLFDHDGEPQGVVAVSTDITEREERERKLQARSTAMEASIDGMAILDEEAEYVFVNQAHADIYGYDDPAAFVGESWTMCYGDGELARLEAEAMPTLYGEGGWRGEAVGTRADGTTFPQELSLTLTDDGGVVCVVRDVTERVAARRQLERQNERLDEFARIVAHDLRGPLNVATGRIDLAREAPENDHLDAAATALARMDTIIEETLTLARQGQAVGDTEPVDVAGLVRQCWTTLDAGDASLRVEAAPTVRADRDRLRHVFENLFRNCVEHAGRDVTVRVGSLPDGRGFYVEDDGPGITDGDHGRVFDLGYTTAEEGSGFGLPIARGIVEAHGWEIAVAAGEGEGGGARFEVTDVDVAD